MPMLTSRKQINWTRSLLPEMLSSSSVLSHASENNAHEFSCFTCVVNRCDLRRIFRLQEARHRLRSLERRHLQRARSVCMNGNGTLDRMPRIGIEVANEQNSLRGVVCTRSSMLEFRLSRLLKSMKRRRRLKPKLQRILGRRQTVLAFGFGGKGRACAGSLPGAKLPSCEYTNLSR